MTRHYKVRCPGCGRKQWAYFTPRWFNRFYFGTHAGRDYSGICERSDKRAPVDDEKNRRT